MTYGTPEKFMLSQDFATLLNLEVVKPRSELAGGRRKAVFPHLPGPWI